MKNQFEIIPLTSDRLPEAAELLAQRHARDRQALPYLPAQYEKPFYARAAVEAALEGPHAAGLAAVENGRLLGYLIGEMVIEPTWGRSAWVRLPGYAVAAGHSLELLRDLYAELGRRWMAYGCFAHFTLALTADPQMLHTWFSLSFGIEQVHGALLLEGRPVDEVHPPDGVEIRPARKSDRQAIIDLSDVIWRHQVQAPVWGLHLPEIEEEQRQDWGDLVNDPQAALWLAYLKGRPVGVQGMFQWEYSALHMHIPDHAIELGVAGVRPEARGLGISRALTCMGLNYARSQGCKACVTDWRSTNLLSSRHWPRQGFQPTVYRLVRRIDPRITWANGSGIDFGLSKNITRDRKPDIVN